MILDLLPWRRGCAHRQLHQAPVCRTMLSHLCCLMNVDVTLFAVVLQHVIPSLLWSSLSYCPMHISVECQFRISSMIHSLHMTKLLHSPLLHVCDLLRPGVDQPYHTPLYSWFCLCELLLQSSSNATFQIPVICFPMFVLKSKFQSCTSIHWVPLSHIPLTS